MAQIETQGILQDIETLISDQLQVVSYKWLSRNYLVSSNDAKRLLQEFVENHESGLEVVYTLSGQLKGNPLCYHVRLVSGPKLAEAKDEFDGNCTVGVYSVQPCIPKDPATMWNAEFVQAEELHEQAPTDENCLRDNRFCGILNSFVIRNVEGKALSTAAPQLNTKLAAGPLKTSLAHQDIVAQKQVQNKGNQSSPKVGHAPNVVKDVKSESNGIGIIHQPNKPPVNKDKLAPPPANKKKVQSDKSSSASGGSLANMWGRASVKSNSNSNNLSPNYTGTSADAQICAKEAVPGVSSDDDDQDVNFKRTSSSEVSRKRRVVFDFSDEDECEDAVNLASPEYPKGNACHEPKGNACHEPKGNACHEPKGNACHEVKESSKTPVANLNFDEDVEDQPETKEEISVHKLSEEACKEDSLVVRVDKLANALKTQRDAGIILKEKKYTNKMDKSANAASRSPQRRKVLKTRIDERGREVTEVEWEGKETEAKKPDSGTSTKADSSATVKADSSTTKKADNAVTSPTIRPSAAQKPVGNAAPISQTAKAGTKKGAIKDPKQGNILSFFKKV